MRAMGSRYLRLELHDAGSAEVGLHRDLLALRDRGCDAGQLHDHLAVTDRGGLASRHLQPGRQRLQGVLVGRTELHHARRRTGHCAQRHRLLAAIVDIREKIESRPKEVLVPYLPKLKLHNLVFRVPQRGE